MSDSLFLDPFAEPPRESADRSKPGADLSVEEVPTSLVAEIPLAAERAVEAFLEYVHLWWPGMLRAFGDDSHISFEDGTLLEEGFDGGRHRWADVVGIEGASLALLWFGSVPAEAAGTGADVTVEFTLEPPTQTRVTVWGSGPGSVLQDWLPAVVSYARFTGGSVRASAE